jgi:hypothetical protein
MTIHKEALLMLAHTMLSIALTIGYVGSAGALDAPKTTVPCNLSRSLGRPHPWMKNPDIIVILESLTRTPAMMTRITWAYCNESTSTVEINGWDDLAAIDQGAQIVRLHDDSAGKTYSPMLLEGFAYGSLIPNTVQLLPGDALTVWMNFPMVPTTTAYVDVNISEVETFSTVPIE